MNLRNIAAQILLRVLKDGQSLTVALESLLSNVEDNKQRAFVQAICYGVCRQYYRLDFLVEQLVSKPLRNKDMDIKVLLLIGLYQLQYMRVKPHAAVSETVAAEKKKSWAKALINGVLRQYLREQDALEQLADDNQQARLSHPDWMIRLIENSWPQTAEQILRENNQPAPMVLRVNLRQGTRADYLNCLVEHGIAAQAVNCCDTAILLDQAMAVELLPGFNDGKVSVQDSAAQLAVRLLDVQAGHKVLDMCAAPGGKTAAILERQPAVKSMLAIDIDEVRLLRVKENLERLKLQAETQVADASTAGDWSEPEAFDRILLDAPCSALGVIRRHPDIKLLRRESDIEALQYLQNKILNVAWDLLVPGGILLYATCSVLKQENEWQIESFLKQHSDAVEIKIEAEWGLSRPFGRQIVTGDGQMDGFYYARLCKGM
jgi:16S rRNA (cytosine967-C5)-methyltransferase